jgi:adenine phosphoribosyltransferase
MSLNLLKKSLENAPIVKKGSYSYVIHPITDGIPEIDCKLLEEVVTEIEKHVEKCGKIDKIVTMEAMGIPLATALSLRMKIPFTIIRKRNYDLPGEISVQQMTGYSKSQLFINGLNSGDKIVIVDDVLSTGGTLKAILEVLGKLKVNVKGIFIAINKGKSKVEIMDKYKVNIVSLVDIDVVDEKVVFLKTQKSISLA